MAGEPGAEVDRPRAALLLLVLVILAAALRFNGLGAESLWLDEAVTWLQSRRDVVTTIVETARDTYPPLHNLLTLLAVKLFGEGEAALRLPAAIVGTLTVPCVYWLGRQTAGATAALIAAAMTALAPFAVAYAQEARMYALLMLGAALFAATVIAWLRAPSPWRALAMVGAGFVLLYTHPYGAFSWFSTAAAAGAVLLVHRAGARRLLGFLGLQAAIVVLFAPWLLVSLRVTADLAGNGFWIPAPTFLGVVRYVTQAAGGQLGLDLLLAGWVLVLLPRSWLPQASAPSGTISAVPILLAGALGPLLLGLAASFIVTPVLIGRYLICCLPAAIVLAALGYCRLGPRLLALPLLLTGLLLVPALVADLAYRHGEDWRGLAAYLRYEMKPEDCLFVDEGYTVRALRYYRRQTGSCLLTDLAAAQQPGAIPPGARLFAVLSHSQLDMHAVRAALPGSWHEGELHFGPQIALAIRAPTP